MNANSLYVTDVKISEPISVNPLGNRLYSLANEKLRIRIETNCGDFVFDFKRGFVTNFRSGGLFVDRFVDQIGGPIIQACWLFHDAAYTPCEQCNGEHPISRKLADELLKESLLVAGMGEFKAKVVYRSVRLFGGSAYDEDDSLTETNRGLFSFHWESGE